MRLAAALCLCLTPLLWTAVVGTALVGTAQAQVITAQPLPPPGGVAPASPHPVARPAPRKLAVVRPQHPPVKRAAPRKSPAAVKPAAKPLAKPGAPATAPAPPPKIDPNKGTTTGLPLPRWASLRSNNVNLRSGPGTQYPIQWVYHRQDLPVQILREFEIWRLVQEQDGTKGWVHEATLSGRRGYVVQGGEQVLRANPDDAAEAVAKLELGVVGAVQRCPAGSAWCDVQAGAYHGWLRRSAMYGVGDTEAIP